MEIGVSFSLGHTAYSHDVRKTHTANVDTSLSGDNVVLVDRLQGRTVEAYTNEWMQPYIDAYNAKQKRSDRKINEPYSSYFYKISPKKRGELAYEFVMQYGEHETLGEKFYEGMSKEEMKKEFTEVYKEELKHFQKTHPHLEVLWATIHFDEPEGTPHLHIAVQPIGEGYKQGLEKQISIGKALALDGYERIKDRSQAKDSGFQMQRMFRKVREHLKENVFERGYDLKEEAHGNAHKTKTEWELEKRKDALIAQNAVLSSKNAELDAKIEEKTNTAQNLDNAIASKESTNAKLKQAMDLIYTNYVEVFQSAVNRLDKKLFWLDEDKRKSIEEKTAKPIREGMNAIINLREKATQKIVPKSEDLLPIQKGTKIVSDVLDEIEEWERD